MACCSTTGQKYWIGGCSAFTILAAIIIGLLWPSFALKYLLYPQLVLKEGSQNYENWKETPIPIYLEIFFFNWTNHQDVHNHSIKPHFTEMGPYVFSEKHIRTNLTWNDNGTITFYQKRIWHFEPEKSNGLLTDEVTNMNTIAATVAYSSRYFNSALKSLIKFMMSMNRGPIVVTKTVEELLFKGYSDPLLDLVRANGNPDIVKPPFTKFGWFVERNNSEIYDGNFTMNTGENDIMMLGMLQLWNSSNRTHLYRGKCDNVMGTTGELWPPIAESEKPPLTVFATDVCRGVTVNYDSDYSLFGINGYRWVADASVFDNGTKHPDMACYCTADEESCPDLLSGVFNASACKFGAPAFVSFPHFYLADDHYRNSVDGMRPTKNEHEFSVAMEPRTGIPLNVTAQLQINLLMKSYDWTTFVDVPEVIMPMLWFRQVAQLTPELAKQAKIAVILPDIGAWIAYLLGGIGGVLIVLFGFLFVTRWRQERSEDDELLTDS